MPFNVSNKTIYLIYSLNNLCLLSLSLTKKNFNHCHVNVIHMRIIAFCIHFSITTCCPYLTSSSICNYGYILCFLVTQWFVPVCINPLKPELNPICYLLALLAHHFLHVSRIRVKLLTFRRLMSYIYMEHPFLMFLDYTQRRSTVGRTPLDE